MKDLKSVITGGLTALSRGLQNLWVKVALTEAQKNLKLAQEGYKDVGRVLLPISAEEQAIAIERARRDLENVQRDHQELGR